MADERNYLEHSLSYSESLHGHEATPAEMVMQGEVLGHGPGWVDKAAASLPFGRLLAAEEVANLAIFLLSDAAGPMTGALVDQEQWVVGAKT